jgi:hypothetical protein
MEEIRGRRPQRVVDMRRVFDDKDVDGVVVAALQHWHAEHDDGNANEMV